MRHGLVLLAGLLMVLSAGAHGLLGWSELRAELATAGVGPELTTGIGLGWQWGSAAMLGFGAICIIGGLRLRRGDRSGIPPIRAVAITYIGFGLIASFAAGFEPPFLVFLASGLLAGLPTLWRG